MMKYKNALAMESGANILPIAAAAKYFPHMCKGKLGYKCLPLTTKSMRQ